METKAMEKIRLDDELERLEEYAERLTKAYADKGIQIIASHEVTGPGQNYFVYTIYKLSNDKDENSVITKLMSVDYYGYGGLVSALHKFIEDNYGFDKVLFTTREIVDFKKKFTSQREEKVIAQIIRTLLSEKNLKINVTAIHERGLEPYYLINGNGPYDEQYVAICHDASEVISNLCDLNKGIE